MERRKINLSTNKDGHGTVGFRVALPTSWVKQLGFSTEDKKAVIELDENKIIIKKETINMLLIKKYGGRYDYENYDYELENGILLFSKDWNGEAYIKGFDPNSKEWNNDSFKAIYRFQEENINIEELEENSPEWNRAVEILGFEQTM